MILFLICLLFRFFIERLKFFVNSLNAKLLVFFGNNDGSNTSKYSAQCHVSSSRPWNHIVPPSTLMTGSRETN